MGTNSIQKIDNWSSSPYLRFSQQQWQRYRAGEKLTITEAELSTLRGFNEHICLSEVEAVYLPLCRLINLEIAATKTLQQISAKFLGQTIIKAPYIIGITGSVAVGKSTTSRILKNLLSRWPNNPKVHIVTTDGFLYPNKVLQQKNLMHRKGFPESFQNDYFIQFLTASKAGQRILTAPIYSHERYDIIEGELKTINQADILIVEGLNLLNYATNLSHTQPPASDFLDFSIYVDAPQQIIEQWYLQRFMAFREQAREHPQRYFYRFTKMSDTEAYSYAKNIWHNINAKNLAANILPYRNRAQLILAKSKNHSINTISLRHP